MEYKQRHEYASGKLLISTVRFASVGNRGPKGISSRNDFVPSTPGGGWHNRECVMLFQMNCIQLRKANLSTGSGGAGGVRGLVPVQV